MRRNATRRGVSKEGPSSQDDDPSASAPAAAATRTSKAKAKKQIDSADETEEEPARPATRSAPAGKKQPAAALPAAKTTPSKAQKRGPEALADDTLSESDTESDDTSKGKKTPVKKQAAAATPSSSKSNKTPRKAGTPKGKADGWGADLVPEFERLPVTMGVMSDRGLRLPFSEEEEAAIRRGLQLHPPVLVRGALRYQWGAILNDPALRPIFHASRTSVNLKDKFRTMQKHEQLGGTPRPKTPKASSKPQPYRAKKADSLLNIRVMGPDGQYLFDETAVAWSSVAGFCARVLGKWGVTGGFVAFETDDGYKLVSPNEDVIVTVDDAGGVNLGTVVALPKF